MILLIALTTTVVAIGGAVGAFALKYGAEDRPGFSERSPLG